LDGLRRNDLAFQQSFLKQIVQVGGQGSTTANQALKLAVSDFPFRVDEEQYLHAGGLQESGYLHVWPRKDPELGPPKKP